MGQDSTKDKEQDRQSTFTQRARRAQIIDVTIELLAEHGFSGVSLSQIADSAGVTKPTVLYHFTDKATLVRGAYQHVLDAMVESVGEAVASAEVAERPSVYVRSIVAHFISHRSHSRLSVEALIHGEARTDSSARWRPVAELLRSAREARGVEGPSDSRTAALIIGGAIDAVVGEALEDPGYDAVAASEEIVDLVEQRFLTD